MQYYLLIGFVLTVSFQMTPSARKRPYKFLEGIPIILFILFCIGRGLLLVLIYPVLIILLSGAYIHIWFEKSHEVKMGAYSMEIQDLVRRYANCRSIMIDEDEYLKRLDHPPTISLDDGLLKYTLHYY